MQTRREFVRYGVLGTGAVVVTALGRATVLGGVTALGEGCGGNKNSELSCKDTSKLSAAEIQGREALKYIDKSNVEGKNCANCLQYVPAPANQCGGCKIMKGPINPKGYCISWVAQS